MHMQPSTAMEGTTENRKDEAAGDARSFEKRETVRKAKWRLLKRDLCKDRIRTNTYIQGLNPCPLLPFETACVAIDPVHHLFVVLYPVKKINSFTVVQDEASRDKWNVYVDCEVVDNKGLNTWMTYMPFPRVADNCKRDHGFYVTDFPLMKAIFGADGSWSFKLTKGQYSFECPSNENGGTGNLKIGEIERGSSVKEVPDEYYGMVGSEQGWLWEKTAFKGTYKMLQFMPHKNKKEYDMIRDTQMQMVRDIVKSDQVVRSALYNDDTVATHVVLANISCDGMGSVCPSSVLPGEEYTEKTVFLFCGRQPDGGPKLLPIGMFCIIPVHDSYNAEQIAIILEGWLRYTGADDVCTRKQVYESDEDRAEAWKNFLSD